MSKIIVLEGLDGAGKSTQVKLIQDYLKNNKKTSISIHFPIDNNDIYINEIYKELKGKSSYKNPYVIATLFALNRAHFLPKLLNYMETYDFIIIDRYIASNIAYQQALLNNPYRDIKTFIIDMERNFGLPFPDLTLFIDIPLDTLKNRLINRTGEDRNYLKENEQDQYEKIEFLSKVRDNYLNLYLPEFNYKIIRGFIDDKLNKYLDLGPYGIFKLIETQISNLI
jgi:dTMP kinase